MPSKIIKVLRNIALVTLAIPILGLIFQFTATKIDSYRFPPPGNFVNVNNTKMHYQYYGTGDATVIFDPGLGLNSLEWALVQPEVAKFAKTLSFDRPGYGWSKNSKTPRNSKQIVMELHTLLKKAKVPPPYILVGHSLGGIDMQLFCHMYPQEVAGLVLVDSSHPDQTARLPKDPESIQQFLTVLESPIYPYLSLLGIDRISSYFPKYKKLINESMQNFPTSTRKAYSASIFRTGMTKAFQSENALFKESCSQLKGKNLYLENKPLIVITAGRFKDPYPGITDIPQEWFDEMQKEWNQLQKELAEQSNLGKQVIAEKSDHIITRNQPEIIIESIKEIVNQKE